jgi:hypothetical protein
VVEVEEEALVFGDLEDGFVSTITSVSTTRATARSKNEIDNFVPLGILLERFAPTKFTLTTENFDYPNSSSSL